MMTDTLGIQNKKTKKCTLVGNSDKKKIMFPTEIDNYINSRFVYIKTQEPLISYLGVSKQYFYKRHTGNFGGVRSQISLPKLRAWYGYITGAVGRIPMGIDKSDVLNEKWTKANPFDLLKGDSNLWLDKYHTPYELIRLAVWVGGKSYPIGGSEEQVHTTVDGYKLVASDVDTLCRKVSILCQYNAIEYIANRWGLLNRQAVGQYIIGLEFDNQHIGSTSINWFLRYKNFAVKKRKKTHQLDPQRLCLIANWLKNEIEELPPIE